MDRKIIMTTTTIMMITDYMFKSFSEKKKTNKKKKHSPVPDVFFYDLSLLTAYLSVLECLLETTLTSPGHFSLFQDILKNIDQFIEKYWNWRN